MARVRIDGKGLAALIRSTADDAPAPAAPPRILLARIEEIERARDAALERALRAEAERDAARRAADRGEKALRVEREAFALQREEAARDQAALLAQATGRLESMTRERDHLRRTIDSELPQGEAKELLVAALFEKGKEQEGRGNLLDAFHLYRRTLRLEPAHAEALLKVATIYYSAGLLLPAAEALRGVVELDPSRVKVKEQLAVVEELARRRGLTAATR